MGLVRVPWNSQPQQPTAIDQKWVSRGLAYVYIGTKRIWSRDTALAIVRVGEPKARPSLVGIATGFGATYGTGTTDSITGPTLVTGSSRGGRSIVAHVFKNGAGGGSYGRIFDAGNSGGGSEYFYNGLANSLTYVFYTLAASISWTAGHAIPDGVASVQGVSLDLSAPGKQAYFYKNGAFTGVANPSSTPANYSVHKNAVVIGNRSDNDRVWDGWIGSILIFDGPPLTGAEHASLAANPWQVFAPLERNIFQPVAAGGQSNAPRYFHRTQSGQA